MTPLPPSSSFNSILDERSHSIAIFAFFFRYFLRLDQTNFSRFRRTLSYRPGRNAQQAVVEVGGLLHRGHPEVVDADLADYFGSIPHAELVKSVTRRIVDRRVLHLIKMWLECPVEETDDRGRKTRTTEARDNRRGIPQGSPI